MIGRIAVAACLGLAVVCRADVTKGKTEDVICLEGVYAGHLQDVWMDGETIWWAHTRDLVKTDRQGRILKRVEAGGHHAGLEVKDGRLYSAVCAFDGEPRHETTPACHVMVGEYDAETLERIEMHVLDINDRAGSFCFLADGTFLVGCLRHPALRPNEVKFHHVGRDFKLIRTHIVDVGRPVDLGIEVIRRFGNELFLFIYGGPVLKLDARTFEVKERLESFGGQLGFAKDGEFAWIGETVETTERGCTSRLVRKPIVWKTSDGGEAKRPKATNWGKAPNGAFWNGWSPWFIYAPTIGFKSANNAKSYRFEVVDDFHRCTVLTSDQAEISLDDLWKNLPVGYVTVVCRSVGATGEDAGEVGRRTFWKKPAYDGSYAPRAMSFGAARSRILDCFLNLPQIQYLREHAKIDRRYYLSGYPTKMLAAEIEAFVTAFRGLDGNENNTARKEDLIDLSRKAADVLIAGSFPAGSVLEYFPVTYDKGGSEYGRFRDQQDWVMLVYPPQAGIAYVRLYGVTKDVKYLAAAERIAATFLKTQGKDGTWPLRMNARTGETRGKNRLLPFETMQMFEELYAVTGKTIYREASDRAFAYVEKVVVPGWVWEGQFEDGSVIDDGYENLSNFPANQMILHILSRYPGDAKRMAQAEELAKFVEDQFIHWRPPYDAGRFPGDDGEDDGTWNWWCRPYSNWMTPCAVEQYVCCVPVDASAAKCIRALLAVYHATDKRIYLEKACALGATQTRMIEDDGFINTWSVRGVKRNDDRYHTWDNCTVEIMTALGLLAAETEDGAR